MTRAREHLVISYAETRRMFGSENHCRPSRFIDEMPAKLIEEIRPRISSSRPYVAARPTSVPSFSGQQWPFRLGQSVSHAKFGEGTVTAFEGSGEHTRVQVNFYDVGSKWLVVAYANLQAG
jgi:DNA helicase-2/ATP-dependent DNA helicase PcrA